MGSDAALKVSTQLPRKRRLACAAAAVRRTAARWLFVGAALPFVLWTLLGRIRAPVPSFPPTDDATYPLSAPQRKRCDGVALRFHRCQEHPSGGASLVLGCHRKWCDSALGGSCTPCSGLGTRMRCVMGLASLATSKCIRVEFDLASGGGPGGALLTVDDAAYRDTMLAELLHFRSYGDGDGDGDGELKLLRSKEDWAGNTTVWEGRRTYLHGTPDGCLFAGGHWTAGVGQNFEFDPCLFHAVFRPSASLQDDIDRHLATMGSSGAIGIHFRVGDEAAFGIGNEDVRTSGPLEESFGRMMDCARRHAETLLPSQDAVFFLATDSLEVKNLAARDPSIRMTDLRPQSWLRADADYSAWLEVFLLSRTKGLVANKRALASHGSGNPISTFARLAAKIGFMTEDQFLSCDLD